MKAVKMMLIVLLIQSVSFASQDCYDSFRENYDVQDSKSFNLSIDELEREFSQEPELFMREAMYKVIDKVSGCEELAIKVEDAKSDAVNVSCKELMKGKAYSKSCMAESEIGYFFLNVDMLDNINLFFSRWD